ncbi:hypothetical protein G7092_09800 [Mucilaginibacter sp. HC2]|uniref:hypothetical protein n=1 Tax=Mucilaginibacter inviolabilis TaxID=2714892 RepID=UPI00140BC1C7|nr:hypothetical protein [Mucilaginibacter inviolabilis]NHA04091.1 hypothetical protein [Mucilaginibacter inviolabilis]
MKKLITILLAVFAFTANAQTTVGNSDSTGHQLGVSYTYSLPTINALESYAKLSKQVYVTDKLRGGLFAWVPSAIPDSGTVFPAKGGGFWQRRFDNAVQATWFGAVPDGVTVGSSFSGTDNYAMLQQAINASAQNHWLLNLTEGQYNISQPLMLGDYGSFEMNGTVEEYSATQGTLIQYTGKKSNVGIITFKNRAYVRVKLKNISLECLPDSAAYGVLFNGTNFSQPYLESIIVRGATTSYGILGQAGRNGEFITFMKCAGAGGQKFFYMDSTTGQSFSHLFIQPMGQVRAGGTLFEIGGSNLGFDIHVIDANFSCTPDTTGNPTTLITNHGISGNINFEGGRTEGVQQILYNYNGTFNMQGVITFKGMELPLRPDKGVSVIANSTGSNSRYIVNFENCNISSLNLGSLYINATAGTINTGDQSQYNFKNCNFGGFNNLDVVQSASNETSNITFLDCSFNRNPYGGTAITPPYIISKRYGAPHNFETTKRFSEAGSTWVQSGIPQNLLIYPEWGSTTGSNQTPPKPWVMTGSTSFYNVQRGVPVNTPSAAKLSFMGLSSVYQDITAVPLGGSQQYITYQALVAVSGTFTFDLENSKSGVIYDKVTLNTSNGTYPNTISLIAPSGPTDSGYVRLKITNNGGIGSNIGIYHQMVTNLPNGSYVLPDAGTTKTFTENWGSNVEMSRVTSRFSLPYKYDNYGINGTLPNDSSDVYISKSTGSLNWTAFSKHYQTPPSILTATTPSSTAYPAGTIAYNSNPLNNLSVAWIYNGTSWRSIGAYQYTPSSSADTHGVIGDQAYDNNYFYIKTSTGWTRSALTTF